MARKINEYRVRNGRTRLDEDYFNRVLGDIDTRIHAQEVVEKDWQGAIRAVTSAGLRRINDFIGPAITEIEQLTDLGFLQVRAAPDVDVVWQVGEQPIALALDTDADRTRVKHFHPSPFIVVTDDADPATYLIARTLGMDRTRDDADAITGAALRLDVVSVVGSPAGGTVLAPWCVSSPAATALLVSTTEDGVAARDAARAARDTAQTHRDDALYHRSKAEAAQSAAETSESNAATSESKAAASEANAEVSAQGAADSAGTAQSAAAAAVAASSAVASSMSASELTVGRGNKSLTVGAGEGFLVSGDVDLIYRADATVWMSGTVTAYDAQTGALDVYIKSAQGEGTYAEWVVRTLMTPEQIGAPTQGDARNMAQRRAAAMSIIFGA